MEGLTRVCRLAEGGMGRVDLAIRRVGEFRRMYAVKRLHPHLASDPDCRAMFIDEARIAGRLRHANVVGVLDVGEDTLGPYLIMDYVDGLPLGNLIRMAHQTGEPMPVQICVRIALDIARGLHAAHELTVEGRALGLVHRDLSPQNVLIGFDGVARITDFGIAKALGRNARTSTGVLKGKLAYMAPEQLRMEAPDRRSDLFALGVVLFEMLSGQRLYSEKEPRQILEQPPPDIGELRGDVPDELVRLLFELLARDRADRPPDAREVARRLEMIYATLVTEEDAADVADYVEVVGGDSRKEQERVLSAAIEEAERTLFRPARGGLSRRALWVIASISAVVLAGATTWAVVLLTSSGAEPAGTAPAALPPGAPDALAAEDRQPAAPSGPEGAPGGNPDGPAAHDEGSADGEPVARRSDERRRRPPRRRPPAPASMTETAAMDERLPDWVDFER